MRKEYLPLPFTITDVDVHVFSSRSLSYSDLPSSQRVDLATFCTLAALSERVVSLEPAIKKLINKIDLEAFRVKINKSKVAVVVVVIIIVLVLVLVLVVVVVSLSRLSNSIITNDDL